ncbi:general secretion pathway protein G [Oxalobacteraceae bacterium GrIS 2.11]
MMGSIYANRPSRGFTYVELTVTLAILAVLAMVALPFAELTVKRQQEFELRRALRDIREAIDAYKMAANTGQISVGKTDSGYPASLAVLVKGVPSATAAGTTVYFLRRIPVDPFYPNQAALPDQMWGLRSYASPADAPQKGNDVFDVYSLSTEVGLNDIPYRNW